MTLERQVGETFAEQLVIEREKVGECGHEDMSNASSVAPGTRQVDRCSLCPPETLWSGGAGFMGTRVRKKNAACRWLASADHGYQARNSHLGEARLFGTTFAL